MGNCDVLPEGRARRQGQTDVPHSRFPAEEKNPLVPFAANPHQLGWKSSCKPSKAVSNISDPESNPVVPKAVVNRLSLYLRELQRLAKEDEPTISSSDLARRLGLTASQIRKDFAYFGQFGYPGVGYRCNELVAEIRKIFGTDQVWPVALIGCGNLGQALLGYRGFDKQGFRVVAAFDSDPAIVGQSFEGLVVRHIDDLQSVVAEHQVQLAILAVPSAAADQATEAVIAAGITGIMNFAPVTLKLPSTVSVVGVDLAMELEQLTFSVVNRGRTGSGNNPATD